MRRIFSAGGIVFKGELVLIRRPKPNEGYNGNSGWSFPKGLLDGGEKVEDAAVREVGEEGGVVARVVSKLPAIKIFFKDKGETVMKFITYFLMEWVADKPEGHDRETEEVKWVTREEALEMLAFKNEKELLAGC